MNVLAQWIMETAGFLAQYILPFIAVLTVVVFVHEFGHYWVARRRGVRVEVFSIGFGKEIIGRTDKHGTRWSLSWLPLGGYVKMFGDADPTSARSDPELQNLTSEQMRQAFFTQSAGGRFAIASAGPLANITFTVAVLAVLFMLKGMSYIPPVIAKFQPESPAQRAGLMIGDKVLSIDNTKVETFDDISRLIKLNTGAAVNIEFMRGDTKGTAVVEPIVAEITDHFGGKHRSSRIGIISCAQNKSGAQRGGKQAVQEIAPDSAQDLAKDSTQESVQESAPAACQSAAVRELNPLQATAAAFSETWKMTTATFTALGQMVVGSRGTEELGGPVRIAEMAGRVSREGFAAFIWFTAMLSLNLGLINLLPVPALDGGHLMYCIAEKIRGRPLGERTQEWGARIGLGLIALLMVVATWNDLVVHLRIFEKVRQWWS